MSSARRNRGTLAVIAASSMALAGTGGVAMSSAADAVTDGPRTGCVNTGVYHVCDGPIQHNNTFLRCRISPPIPTSRGSYLPVSKKCWVIDRDAPAPSYGHGLPQQHVRE